MGRSSGVLPIRAPAARGRIVGRLWPPLRGRLEANMNGNLSRREALKVTGLAGIAGLLAPQIALASAANRKRSLRIAHLTDIHVEPERRAGDGMAAAFRHANELADRP